MVYFNAKISALATMKAPMLYFFYLDLADVFSLTVQPHLDPGPINFSFDLIRSVFFTQNFGRRQPIQDASISYPV